MWYSFKNSYIYIFRIIQSWLVFHTCIIHLIIYWMMSRLTFSVMYQAAAYNVGTGSCTGFLVARNMYRCIGQLSIDHLYGHTQVNDQMQCLGCHIVSSFLSEQSQHNIVLRDLFNLLAWCIAEHHLTIVHANV